jgi:hypothetical protein
MPMHTSRRARALLDGTLALALLVLVGTAGAARAEGSPSQPLHLRLVVGSLVEVCATSTLACPAGAARCDDLKVARPTDGKEGLAFLGVGPGETLCSAGSSSGQGARQVFRLTVTAPPKGQ